MKVVLMHGKDTDSKGKWYPWIGDKIRGMGMEFIAPDLPNSEDPEINSWLDELEKTKPEENTILIGHSRGGVAVLRWLENLPSEKKVKKVILVAANSGHSEKMNRTENNKGFFSVEGYDFEKIKSHCDDFVVIHSRDDEWVPFEAGEENAKGLNAKFKIYEDKNHFGRLTPEVPEVLEEIK